MRAKTQAKVKAKAGAKDNTGDSPGGLKKGKSSHQLDIDALSGPAMWREAVKLKGRLTAVMAQAAMVNDKIGTDDLWRHLQGKEHGKLVAAENAMKSSLQAPWRQFFMLTDPTTAKKKSSAAEGEVELKSFMKECGPLVDKLASKITSLHSAHNVLLCDDED